MCRNYQIVDFNWVNIMACQLISIKLFLKVLYLGEFIAYTVLVLNPMWPWVLNSLPNLL